MRAQKNYKISRSLNKLFWYVFEFETVDNMKLIQYCHTRDKALEYMDKLESMNDPENF